ncbi:MAG: 6-phosphogluconolactonase [Candidatus Riflebacteria bacterium]|nr:6-phosphogluconolactonase [Candidatus Riflebacteria bacterium]
MADLFPLQGRAVRVADDQDTLASAAASVVLACAMATPPDGELTVALSGGRTPRRLHSLLATPPLSNVIPWARVVFLLGDERCVPPDHAESNFGMVQQTLVSRLPEGTARVHRVQAEQGPDPAAALYEEVVRDVVKRRLDGVPSLDLVFLGVGEDGHTASLFPGGPALSEATRLVAPVAGDGSRPARVTFTLRLLNASKLVVFLVSGSSKAAVVKRALEPGDRPDPLPCQRVKPVSGAVLWLLDRAAAASLAGATLAGLVEQ